MSSSRIGERLDVVLEAHCIPQRVYARFIRAETNTTTTHSRESLGLYPKSFMPQEHSTENAYTRYNDVLSFADPELCVHLYRRTNWLCLHSKDLFPPLLAYTRSFPGQDHQRLQRLSCCKTQHPRCHSTSSREVWYVAPSALIHHEGNSDSCRTCRAIWT